MSFRRPVAARVGLGTPVDWLYFIRGGRDEADGRVRQVVVQAAARLLDPADRDGRAVDVVRGRVLDLSASVSERVALVRLLGRTGSPRGQPILLSLARSKPTALRVAVVEALGLAYYGIGRGRSVISVAYSGPDRRSG